MSSKRNKGGNKVAQPQTPITEIEECYWANPTHSLKFGLMKGRVTKEQAAWYDSVTPDGVSYTDKTLSYDPISKREKEAKLKRANREY